MIEEEGKGHKGPLIIVRPPTPEEVRGGNKRGSTMQILSPQEIIRNNILADMKLKEEQALLRMSMIKQKEKEEDDFFAAKLAALKGQEYTITANGPIPVNTIKG